MFADSVDAVSLENYEAESGIARAVSSSEDTVPGSEHLDEVGRLVSKLLPAPVVHDLSNLRADFLAELEQIAEEPRTKGRLKKDVMRRVLIKLCRGQFITRHCLAE